MSKLVERLIVEIKEKWHLKYDEDVADIVNITPSHLNRMKKREGQPNAANFVRLAIAAEWDMTKANIILNDGIEGGVFNHLKEKGYAAIALLFVLALSSTLVLASIPTFTNSVYYVK